MVRAEPPAILIGIGNVKPATVIALSTLAILLVATPKSHVTPWLIWNASQSVPIGLYVIMPTPPRRGDLALARLPPLAAAFARRRGYLTATAYVLKRVAAVDGDRVCRIGHRIFVQSKHRATALHRDERRRIMPAWQGCRQLAGGEVLLLADDARSFDSRYFGPVAAEHIVGRAVPLIQMG